MEDILSWQKIANALLVAIPTAYLSSVLAFRKYRSEKWWDRRSQCYCDTIDALNEIIVVCDAFIDEKVQGVQLRKADRDALEEKYRKSKGVCFMQINIGKLFMSDEAHKSVMGFERELFVIENEPDKEVVKEGIREVTEAHLNALIPIARADLSANPLFRGFFQ